MQHDTGKAKGPIDYAEFCVAAQRSQLSEGDFRQLYDERINEALLLAQRLATDQHR